MAASDKPLRDQNTLDMVFAVSSIAMLVSAIMMFAQDYFREWKPEQRFFRQVEQTLAQRFAIDQIPSVEELDEAEAKLKEARDVHAQKQSEIAGWKKELARLAPGREVANITVNSIKSEYGSIQSLYYIDLEHGNNEEAKYKLDRLNKLSEKLAVEEAKRDAIETDMKETAAKIDAVDKDLTKKLGEFKKLNDKFDAMVTLSIKKEWTGFDSFRAWPIIDGFASPTKIQQITNNDYGINYNFKDVTRFDRCTTCHLGIDRPAYTRANLRSLLEITPNQTAKLEEARERLKERRNALSGLPEAAQVPDPEKLKLSKLSREQLTDARINQFAAHPRLDLFVAADSKHPMEKFGCTTCHNGQGSSTSFHWASHTPNDTSAERKWTKDLGWSHIHPGDWEFPMNPRRFAESTCLKCHHQVTDLISSDNKVEAPKLLRGYNLIRENGCFGCHEIAGRKGGRDVGPDMRLESTPPLTDLPPAEQVRIDSDLENRPGNLRKVGPSLYRFAEKSNEEFTAKWVRAPREFRPDTKMPHFYGTSNNSPDVLPKDQKEFPDAEIHAVTHYLFKASNDYLKDIAKFKTDAAKEAADAEQKDLNTVFELAAAGKLSDKQKETMEQTQRRIRLRKATTLTDLTGGYQGDAKKGRVQFIERGCLSCHVHQATEKKDGDSPAVFSEALFGPNLSQVAAKLGKSGADKAASAKLWLVQWLLDPKVHNPRTRMPITHLSSEEAADIAAWLLAQPASDFGPQWNDLQVAAPKAEDLEELAKVYLVRTQLSKSQIKSFFDTKEMLDTLAADLPAEERDFVQNYKAKGEDALKHFVGKKAVGRLGCYACHDIPGFDAARPIGVGLNDWGKKDANKLAFEDIGNFFKKHYYEVEQWTDEDGHIAGPKTKDGVTKLPYETFFADALLKNHGNPQGYLFQKLHDPRSYDYNRIKAWDDRARMPQFKFSRLRKKAGENDKDFEARGLKEEAEAREAVATFVLGLVGEAVPASMTNRPSGDRLAEIKGRQTLDAFNCAGCHLIRSGTFEVKANERVLSALAGPAKISQTANHAFPNHFYWTGQLAPTPDTIKFHGVVRQPMAADDEAEENKVDVRLTQALRFITADKKQADIPSSTPIGINPADFTYPSPAAFATPERLKQYLKDRGQYGGAFSDLLVGYLERKNPKDYPKDQGLGDSSKARPLVPPSLIGQGERTRPEWLYEFLLNPFRVRKMTILQMPKFNLSNSEAQSLVDYFGAVERQNNPGIGLTYPYEQIKQQDAASAAYFQKKSADYVARLKAEKVKEGGKERSMFDMRVDELTPIWQAALKDYEGQKDAVKAKLDAASEQFKAAEAKEKSAQKSLDDAKGKKGDIAAADAEYKAAKAALDVATRAKEAWENASTELTAKIASHSVDKQKEEWAKKDAYLTDAFKLVANKDLCMKCHQIGSMVVKNDVQGPELLLAHSRLRPGWTERWLAHPNRFLPYESSMPVNFPKDQPDQYREFFVGSPLERVQAVRDVLMVLPRASQIPANRYWMLPLPGDAK
jgi:mono/diheme cytochrome c family protein